MQPESRTGQGVRVLCLDRARRHFSYRHCSGTLKTRKRDSENTKNRFFVFYVSNRQFLAVF
ncbi:hypothetical protein A7C81_21770 [Salmonella enterica subsp. enterica serovar Rubislaw]|nr:hypothetical protein [Salmonella enterica subsp. enterica serovar Rubislaw]